MSLVAIFLGNTALAQTESGNNKSASADSAASSPVAIVDVAIGFGRGSEGGLYKVGLWCPVNVTLRGGAAATTGVLEIEATDGDGFQSIVKSPPVNVPAGSEVQHQLLVRPGTQAGTITVRVRDAEDGKIMATRQAELIAMLSSQQLWVQVGESLRTGDAVRTQDLADTNSIEISTIEKLEDLPTRWFGYEAVDVLFVSVADLQLRDNFRGNARLNALEDWVKAGGRLILAVGAESATSAEFFAAGDDAHPLARFLPGTFERMEQVPQIYEVQRFADTNDRLEIGTSFRVPRIKAKSASIVRSELQSGVPIVVESAYGFGRVTYVAMDWHRPPFSTWTARGRFIAVALGLPLSTPNNQELESTGQLSHAGITDMSAQLRSGLDQFPEVSIVPFWAIALAIVGYIALIGPVDYFLIKRLFGRNGHSKMELTWITFPIWVILVSGAAYWIAADTKGDNLHVNQLVVEDHDLDSGTVRGSSWFAVFSPSMATFDIRMKGSTGDQSTQAMTTWLGLPGRVLGGMAADNTLTMGRGGGYGYDNGYQQLQATPIPVWSSRCFTSRWLNQAEDPALEVSMQAVAGEPSGSIRNNTGEDLTNCLFAYRRWAYLIPELPDGATVSLTSFDVDRRELRDELNGRRLTLNQETNQYETEHDAYDILNRDLNDIARMMSLYESAGGKEYTGLEHRYQAFMDLTPQIELKRGVLVGFVKQPEGSVEVQAESNLTPQTRNWKCMRFVFDVEEVSPSQ